MYISSSSYFDKDIQVQIWFGHQDLKYSKLRTLSIMIIHMKMRQGVMHVNRDYALCLEASNLSLWILTGPSPPQYNPAHRNYILVQTNLNSSQMSLEVPKPKESKTAWSISYVPTPTDQPSLNTHFPRRAKANTTETGIKWYTLTEKKFNVHPTSRHKKRRKRKKVQI